MNLGAALTVGGTGMLAAVSALVARRSDSLHLASRHPHDLANRIGALPLPLNWRQPKQAMAAVNELPPLAFLLSWVHRDGEWLLPHLTQNLTKDGRWVQVCGSRNWREPLPQQPAEPTGATGGGHQLVILGSFCSGSEHRWLSHKEICAGVFEAIDCPEKRVIHVGNAGSGRPGRHQ